MRKKKRIQFVLLPLRSLARLFFKSMKTEITLCYCLCFIVKYHRIVVANTKHLTNIFELVRYIFPIVCCGVTLIIADDTLFTLFPRLSITCTNVNMSSLVGERLSGAFCAQWAHATSAFHSLNIAFGWCLKRAFSLPLAHMDLHASFYMHCAPFACLHTQARSTSSYKCHTRIEQIVKYDNFRFILFHALSFSLSDCSYSVSLTAFRS